MDQFILNENSNDSARSGLLRLHAAVGRREPGRPETTLSPEELLARFRAADPTRNAACLPWLLRTYAAGGYRLEDLSKAHDTLAAFARLRGQLPNTVTIDGEVRNPRKLGSHVTLASLWKVIASLVEAERLAQENEAVEQTDTDKERALSQSHVLHRSSRMVIAVPMTVEASRWWGRGTQWCTAARKNNAFDEYHKDAPLIVICLRKVGDLPARKLQMYVHADGMQFMDENDALVSLELISERWQDLEALLHWALIRNGQALDFVPNHLRTEAICLAVVGRDGIALDYVPKPLRKRIMCMAAVSSNGRALACVPKQLRTKAMCAVAVGRDGDALTYVPSHLRTEAICSAAVRSNGMALKYVPKSLRTEAVCLTAVDRNGEALQYVPKSLRTEAICTAAVGRSGWALTFVSEHLRTEAICTIAVGSGGFGLSYIPESLRTEAICLDAVGRNGVALQYVPNFLRREAICLSAVENAGEALRYVPEPLRTEDICTTAVGVNGWALAYVPEYLCTEAMCLTAVGDNGMALLYVPELLRTEAICTAAVVQNGFALGHVPEPLRTKAICLSAVEDAGEALKYVPEPLRKEVMRLNALDNNKNEFISVTDETYERKTHNLVLEGLKDCLNDLQHSHQEAVASPKL